MPDLPMADRHETVLPPDPQDVTDRLAAAQGDDGDLRRSSIGAVAADHPTSVAAWSELSETARDDLERYAYARVGYHRGLDALRAAGWGGRGYVRWSREENRAFLTCLVRLQRAAAAIGEAGEVVRIGGFLRELDPDWDDANVAR